MLETVRKLVTVLDTEFFEHAFFVILLDRRTRSAQEEIRGLLTNRNRFALGVAIEEIDILDLEEYMDQTDNADIEQVYKNLRNGSESHLRAFVRVLEKETGETYTPQYLSQERYDEIMQGGNGAGGYGDGNSGQGAGQGNGKGSGQGTEQGTGRGSGQGTEQETGEGTRQGNGQGNGRGKNS